MTEIVAKASSTLDQYLASCVASIVRTEPLAPWPSDWAVDVDAAAQRIAFHGIALLIAQAPGALDDWPPVLARAVREQAGIQTFWEASHRAAIAPLLEAFAAAGISALVTKGTALAYSVYHDPALRRRGDTDIYLPAASKRQVSQLLRACGFRQTGDTKALQESWQCDTALGFEPAVDIHWRINASAAVSQMLEAGLRFDVSVALPRLSPGARGIGAVDNLVLTSINRSAHGQFGYYSGGDRLFDTNRLIWAVDVHLLASTFSPDDWEEVASRAAKTGTAAVVRDSLAFAQRSIGTMIPAEIADALERGPSNHGLAAYFGRSSHIWRLRRDLAACDGPAETARVLRYVAFPSDDFLQARFPDAQGWPQPALHLRRWVEGAGKLLAGKI